MQLKEGIQKLCIINVKEYEEADILHGNREVDIETKKQGDTNTEAKNSWGKVSQLFFGLIFGLFIL